MPLTPGLPLPMMPGAPGYMTAPLMPAASYPVPGSTNIAPSLPAPVVGVPSYMNILPVTVAPGALLPGAVPGMPVGETEKISRGKTAFNQLTAKHTIFRGSLLSIPVGIGSTAQLQDIWYSSNADDLEALLKIALPIDVMKIAALRDWLWDIDDGAMFSPGDMVKIIRKQIIHENVSFPEIELPARIVRFLKKVLHPSRAASLALMKQKDTLRTQEFSLVKDLFHAQAAVKEAQAKTYTSDMPRLVAEAEGAEAEAQRVLAAKRKEIDGLTGKILALQNETIDDTALFNLLLSKLDDPEIHADYNAQLAKMKRADELMAPGIAAVQAKYAERGPVVDRLKIARDNLMQAKRDLANGLVDQASVDINQSIVNQLSARIAALNADADAIYADQQIIREANPDIFSKDNDWAVIDIPQYVTHYLTHLCDQKPDQLVTLLENVLSDGAAQADSVMNELLQDRQDDIAAKQGEFDSYFQAQAEVKIKYYTDLIHSTQDQYNAMAALLQKEYDDLIALQNKITASIDALGGVIGWMCHEESYTAENMKQPWFINVALRNISAVRGKYDFVTMSIGPFSQTKKFWESPGTSWDRANETIMDMQALDSKNLDYQSGNGEKMRQQLQTMYDFMQSLHDAYKVTQKYVNSPAFVQTILSQFNQTPEQKDLQSDMTQIATQLRDIQAMTQYDQEQLSPLIDDIEQGKLEAGGVKVPDTQYMDFPHKRHVWYGVIAYLKKTGRKMPVMTKALADIQARMNDGSFSEDDHNHAQIIQVAMFNIIGGNLVYRRLERDTDFQFAIGASEEDDARAMLVKAQGA